MTALAKQQADMGKNPPDGKSALNLPHLSLIIWKTEILLGITLVKGGGSEITDIQADIHGPSKII